MPVCTLKERLSGGVRQGTNLGPAPYLAAYEKMNWRSSRFSPWIWNGEKHSGKCWQFCKVRFHLQILSRGVKSDMGGGGGGAMYRVGVLCTPTA